MRRNYDQLITELAVETAEIFNGQEFRVLRNDECTWPYTVVSGSSRSLVGFSAQYGHVEAIEEFVTIIDQHGVQAPRHNLLLETDEMDLTSVELDEGELNEGFEDTYDDTEAAQKTELLLHILQSVRPAVIPEKSDIDLGPIEQMLGWSATFYGIVRSQELEAIKLKMISDDHKITLAARKQLRGESYDEAQYERIVGIIRGRYGLTAAEVDKAIDAKMLEIEKRRARRQIRNDN